MANKKFYEQAKAYDLAFSDRYFDYECDFLEWCLKKYSKLSKKKLAKKSFLEMACGPARHAREFAKRGWKSAALDISNEMIDYAVNEAEKENLNIEAIAADMSKFKIKKPVILAATLMESIAHLTTNRQMISHFKSVAKNMVSGGIYVIEATHPLFFFPDDEPNTWISQNGNEEVELTFGLPDDEYNSITQVWHLTSQLKIRKGTDPEIVISNKSSVRWYLAQEMKALIELSGVFDKYWFLGSMYFIPPKKLDDSEDSDSMLIVLRVK